MNATKALKQFNAIANAWLEDLESVNADNIQLRPAENSWSFAEVYDHAMKVTRTYQIPNMKKCGTESAKRKKRKSLVGIETFDVGYKKNVHMKMESFPEWLIELFTPVQRTKEDLVIDFKNFIKEVNDLEEIIEGSSSKDKHYHPLFGDINTKEWFSLIEKHMWQHNKQLGKLKEFLQSLESK